jgi:hypothetical protein
MIGGCERGNTARLNERYARTYGFNSYANRIAIAHRQQNAL